MYGTEASERTEAHPGGQAPRRTSRTNLTTTHTLHTHRGPNTGRRRGDVAPRPGHAHKQAVTDGSYRIAPPPSPNTSQACFHLVDVTELSGWDALSSHGEAHSRSVMAAAQRVLMYLYRTRELGLRYECDRSNIYGMTDSDWAVKHSTSGYVFKFCQAAISWSSKKQTTVALSSCEAEIMAASEAAKEAVYISRLSRELGISDDTPMALHCDNRSATDVAYNPERFGRMKHVERRHLYVRECASFPTPARNDNPRRVASHGLAHTDKNGKMNNAYRIRPDDNNKDHTIADRTSDRTISGSLSLTSRSQCWPHEA